MVNIYNSVCVCVCVCVCVSFIDRELRGQVHPILGMLLMLHPAPTSDPEEELGLELTISAPRPQKISHTLLCHIQHSAEPLSLHVEAEIKVRALCHLHTKSFRAGRTFLPKHI